jgi:REP element-mobilizing transposase RayT
MLVRAGGRAYSFRMKPHTSGEDREHPQRQTAALRRGRVSVPQARYFVTLCAVRPTAALIEPTTASLVCSVYDRLVADADVIPMAFTLMPDHVHLLFRLGERLRLDQVVGKFKTMTLPALDAAGTGWQANFFEHRLRPDEDAESYARYVFMNPYRAGLLGRDALWPWWRVAADFSFLHLLPDGFPPGEWMSEPWEALGIEGAAIGEPLV